MLQVKGPGRVDLRVCEGLTYEQIAEKYPGILQPATRISISTATAVASLPRRGDMARVPYHGVGAQRERDY